MGVDWAASGVAAICSALHGADVVAPTFLRRNGASHISFCAFTDVWHHAVFQPWVLRAALCLRLFVCRWIFCIALHACKFACRRSVSGRSMMHISAGSVRVLPNGGPLSESIAPVTQASPFARLFLNIFFCVLERWSFAVAELLGSDVVAVRCVAHIAGL